MYIDKRKRKNKSYILWILLLVFVSVAFSAGYFMNVNNADNNAKEGAPTQGNLPIPDSLKNTSANVSSGVNIDNTSTSAAVSIPDNVIITPNTKIRFITYFVLCGHSGEQAVAPDNDEINMNEDQYGAKYPDWEITKFTSEEVILRRQLDTLCPKHFIISVKDGYVAVYVYNEEGEKELKEKTDIPISNLTPEDQKSLESGIIADTEDDLELKLEGLSD